jgi:hypothetical protein
VNSTKRLKHISANRVFGAFGDAFECYANDALRRMHPKGPNLVDRVWFGARGKTAKGEAFEIDAHMVEPIGETLAAIIIEAKAVFLPEEAILDDPDTFLDELRRKYGEDPGGEGRDKGVAQLARIIRAILDRAWRGQDCEFDQARAIMPVLLTHDTRMDSPIVCWQLNEDLFELIGEVPSGWRVVPLILLTIEGLGEPRIVCRAVHARRVDSGLSRRVSRPHDFVPAVSDRLEIRGADQAQRCHHGAGGRPDGDGRPYPLSKTAGTGRRLESERLAQAASEFGITVVGLFLPCSVRKESTLLGHSLCALRCVASTLWGFQNRVHERAASATREYDGKAGPLT